MKKVIRYMEKTALSYSQNRENPSYGLEPKGREPQQRRSKTAQHHSYHAEKRSSIPSAHSHTLPAYTSGALGPNPIPREVQRFQYATENILQSVEVYLPTGSPHLGSLRSSEESGNVNSNGNQASNSHTATATSVAERLKHDSLAPPAYTPTPERSPIASGTHTPTPKYFVIYIHGGYLRDPKVSSSSFHPALGQLVNSHSPNQHIREVQPHIAGYASINYRLAKHPDYKQDDSVSKYERRDAKWPDMLDDVISGIEWLQRRYGFGERYLLVGHSIGATIALLACLKADKDFVKPLAVLGMCGIYDFPALHRYWGAEYEKMTNNAGIEQAMYQDASPAHYSRGAFERDWVGKGQGKKKRWFVIAASKGDGRVEWGQVEGMQRVFEGESDSEKEARKSEGNADEDESNVLVDVVEVKGTHDEVWRKGEELARVVAVAVGEMMGLDQ
jgi:acetyl esterase/lipase